MGFGSQQDAEALAALKNVLAPLESACIAFSGGVDSSLVLAVAARTLGPDKVTAFTAVSETYRAEELARARDLAGELGVRHVVQRTHELDDECFVANPPQRCYHCKAHLATELVRTAESEGRAALVDGANRDDMSDFRPGMKAADERGIRHPLVEANLDKAQIRRLSRLLGLSTADSPQQACLASRIPYGEPITVEKLRQIAGAEDALRELGFEVCRVRHHGDVARIELEAGELQRALGLREELVRRLVLLRFTYVTLDLAGFRSGSMNEALAGRSMETTATRNGR